MNKPERKEFDKYIHAISAEIEQAQVKLISAANVQMLLHYWKLGHFILYNQQRLGWGSKFIERTSEALRKLPPEKKGYSPRNLMYMCQFAKLYPIGTIEQLILADQQLQEPTPDKILSVVRNLNESQFTQEPPAQIKAANTEYDTIAQEALAQLENVGQALIAITRNPMPMIESCFINSPISKTNWASHIALMDSKLPLGNRYWYMKQAVEYGYSSTRNLPSGRAES